jgi:predicted  nucleic acid-binding Zn-ribbon protein
MDQKELFPNTSAWMKMAGHIVAKLTDHASDIRSQIVKVDEAIEKKRGEHRALAEELEDVEVAVKEAMAFAAELTPPVDHEQDIVNIVEPEGFGEAPDAEQEPEG